MKPWLFIRKWFNQHFITKASIDQNQNKRARKIKNFYGFCNWNTSQLATPNCLELFLPISDLGPVLCHLTWLPKFAYSFHIRFKESFYSTFLKTWSSVQWVDKNDIIICTLQMSKQYLRSTRICQPWTPWAERKIFSTNTAILRVHPPRYK